MTRHLQFANAGPEAFTNATEPFLLNSDIVPGCLVLIDDDGSHEVIYRSYESFMRIQRNGRWFRKQGRDRGTGEMIYLPEVDLI